MSSAPIVISVENLSKSYQISHKSAGQESFREMLGRRARGLLGARGEADQRDELEEFWALKDVSFDVRQGEVMGVIGRNGAGKSTLLKILSRITSPTEGRVTLKGRVASLLEVGTGFHPDLTGRENIYLNGAILGMSRREIDQRFDEIVDFAEIERFLDTPVKRYSSGMYVRLAFAVASHLEPEVLIIDEVLAVGDAAFQKKSLSKMRGVAKSGRAALFVSHNISAVRNLCDSAIVIESGKIISQGLVEEAIYDYFSLLKRPETYKHIAGRPGLQQASIIDSREEISHILSDAQEYRLRFKITLRERAKWCQVAFTIFNSEDIGLISSVSPQYKLKSQKYIYLDVNIPTHMLNTGNYRVEGAIFDSYGQIEQIEYIIIFEVLRTSTFDQKHTESRGLIRFDAIWNSLDD